jgi:hypothetical protein
VKVEEDWSSVEDIRRWIEEFDDKGEHNGFDGWVF